MNQAPWSRRDERVWRRLVEASLNPDTGGSTLKEAAKAVGGSCIPSLDRRDMFAFAALQAVARACGEAKKERRAVLQPALATLAEECASSVGWNLSSSMPAIAEEKTWAEPDLFAN